jgi:protein transport protein SEC13
VIETNHEGGLTDTKYDYYGLRVATGSLDGTIKIFENEVSVSLSSHSGAVQSVSWSHPKFSSLLASGGSDHRIIIWKEASYQKWVPIYEYSGHSGPVTVVEWAPYQHGLVLLGGSIDGCISLLTFLGDDRWEAKTFFGHNNGVLSACWSPVLVLLNENVSLDLKFATAGADGLVKVWVLENENFRSEVLEKHKGWVRSVCWGDFLISAGEDGNVVSWDHNNGVWNSIEIYRSKSVVYSVDINEQGLVAVSSADNLTKVLSLVGSVWKIQYEVNENGQISEIN